MSSDRPDYTGSVVVENIEAGSVTATITGTVTISGAVTITSGTVTISGPVTVTGSVTVSGTVAISNATVAVTQSGSWNINTVTTVTSIGSTVNVSVQNSTLSVTQSGTWNVGTVTTVGSIIGNVNVVITNASITVAQTGTWTVGISGTVTVTGTVAISGSVTVTGAVTVTGTVSISGSVTVTGTVAISGSVTVSGTVAISGSVTITGAVTVSGTANINITSQSANLTVDLSGGYRKVILEADGSEAGGSTLGYLGDAFTANVDALSTSVNRTVPNDFEVAVAIIVDAATTWKILRDGATVATGSTTQYTMTVKKVLDTNVPAGLHTYSVQFTGNCGGSVDLFIVDEDNTLTSAVSANTDALSENLISGTTLATAAITTAVTGSVRCLVFAYAANPGQTLTLKRDAATIKTWPLTQYGGEYTYEDASLAAGTYSYSLTIGSSISHNSALILISTAGGSTPITVMPYLQNLNIGLDTRARLQPYDRNPAWTYKHYDNTVGPHGATTRWSYTVATGKVGLIMQSSITAMRATAPGTAGQMTAYLLHTVSPYVTLDEIVEITAAAGAPRIEAQGSPIFVPAGLGLEATTIDASTTGTYYFSMNAWILEFDA